MTHVPLVPCPWIPKFTPLQSHPHYDSACPFQPMQRNTRAAEKTDQALNVSMVPQNSPPHRLQEAHKISLLFSLPSQHSEPPRMPISSLDTPGCGTTFVGVLSQHQDLTPPGLSALASPPGLTLTCLLVEGIMSTRRRTAHPPTQPEPHPPLSSKVMGAASQKPPSSLKGRWAGPVCARELWTPVAEGPPGTAR